MPSPAPRHPPRPRPNGRRGQGSLVTDPETSARLARIRQKNTSPELAVRRVLHELGLRFRVTNRDLPGSPDIANRRNRWAVFVHGCFWHRHAGCSRATTPKRNRSFWLAKFEANQRRDRRVARQLRALGYRVVTVWECQTPESDRMKARLARLLESESG